MKIVRCKSYVLGTYFIKPRVIQFRNSNMLNEQDIDNLFKGALRLLKLMITESIEKKYLSRIASLERELKRYKERAKY